MVSVLPGWWFECRFRATGRFVHTALTDQTLNTNIKLWSVAALLFITVAVVVVIVVVHSVLLFMWLMFIFFIFLKYFLNPYQFNKSCWLGIDS